jgi:D-alanyl-D-alanine carboxypeptidase
MNKSCLCSRKTPLGVVAIVFLTLVLSGCSSSSGTPVFDNGTKQLLQNSLDSGRGTIGVPGATMEVIRPDGARWLGVSGLSDIENNTAMVPGLKFRIGSVTKTFTATVILQLVQEGNFSLDDKLESILPGLIPNGNQISIRQLLNHTSGLFDYFNAQNPSFFLAEITDFLRVWTPSELIAVANANPPYFTPPGNGYHYSNTNYILLGMIIEKVTGMTYAQAVASRILTPLRLSNTSIGLTPDMPGGSTQGYSYYNNDWVNTTLVDPSWGGAAGNAISSSGDLVVWCNALANGTLLDGQRKSDMFTFVNDHGVVTQGDDAVYGLGVMTNSSGPIGHSGDFVWGGQASVYQLKGWSFVVLVNASPLPDLGIQNGADHILFGALQALGLVQ